jgi:hypothetical protein
MDPKESEWERQQRHRATERELHAHFVGRRAALRTEKSLDCRVVGRHGPFKAHLVDLSRSGALFTIVDATLASDEDRRQLMNYTMRAWYHFDEGLELQIESRDVRAVANEVRVLGRSGESDGKYAIGVHFRTQLTEVECDRLGVEWADDRQEGIDDANLADSFDRLVAALTPARDGTR